VTPTIETAKDGRITLSWEKGRTFSNDAATTLRNHLSSHKWATLIAVDTKDGMKPRPLPLNTVGLLKVASQQLHLSPQTAMHIAERLYTSGFISYPRTESTVYPEHFDLIGALQIQLSNSLWSDYVRSLLSLGIEKPKGGVDMGDHPPM
jgi:DNA topoisomerase III